MTRTCFVLKIRPGCIEEYEARHAQVWPELVEAMRTAGIRNYSLFRRGLDVIGYAECDPDGETAFRRIGRMDVDQRWSAWMEDVIETETDAAGDLLYAGEIWHMD
jgi:L-rhamnose mutarotase